MSTEVLICDVQVGTRCRKDLGDIEELVTSIKTIGLLHPVVLSPDKSLIVGGRRLEAAKKLGWETIPANVATNLTDLSSLLNAERDENTCRKDFTPTEQLAIADRITELVEPEARERKLSGKSDDGLAGGRGKTKNLRESCPEVSAPKQDELRRTSAIAARAAGTTRRTLEKIRAVVNAAEDDVGLRPLVDKMNETGKVDGAFKKLKVIKQAEAIRAEPIPLPAGPFRVIVIDPPWRYDKRDDDLTHRATCPYPSLSIEEITNFRPCGGKSIKELAHKDCVLWLWTTNAHLPDAFRIAKEWEFTYKTTLTWDKQIMSTGDWLRGQTEHCLMCTKGNPVVQLLTWDTLTEGTGELPSGQTEHCLMCIKGKPVIQLTNQVTIIREQRGAHSAKPDAFYEMVEKLCPGSKVEIFSRTPREGWQTYGDEAGTDTPLDAGQAAVGELDEVLSAPQASASPEMECSASSL